MMNSFLVILLFLVIGIWMNVYFASLLYNSVEEMVSVVKFGGGVTKALKIVNIPI